MQGKWIESSSWNTILDPLNGEPFIKVAEVDETGIKVCVLSKAYSFLSRQISPFIECIENVLAELSHRASSCHLASFLF